MSVSASQPPSTLTDSTAPVATSLARSPSIASTSQRHSLADILEHVDVAHFTFQQFSERISTGRIVNGDATVQVLKRYREDGSAKHKFITLQVAVGAQTYWLRIERGVQQNTKLSTSDVSSSLHDSNDTVKLAKEETALVHKIPKCKEKSAFLFFGGDGRKPTLKDLARLLPAIRRFSNYNIATWNCFFVAAVLEEALTHSVKYDCTCIGARSKWATKRQNNAARESILIEFGVLAGPGV